MFHVKQIDEVQQRLLGQYVDLLLKWNSSHNLIGRSTEGDIWQRHILDCAQLDDLIETKCVDVCDIGAGAGLPGVVLSILGFNTVTLIEVDQKKCVFLREVKRQLKLDFEIISSRVEEIHGVYFDLLVSRAVASVDKVIEMSRLISKNDSKLILLKGKGYKQELDEAIRNWSYTCKVFPSNYGSDGVMLVLEDISRIKS